MRDYLIPMFQVIEIRDGAESFNKATIDTKLLSWFILPALNALLSIDLYHNACVGNDTFTLTGDEKLCGMMQTITSWFLGDSYFGLL